MNRILLLCLSPLLLASCIDRVSMQSRYDGQRDKCRDVAEEKTGQAVETEDLGGQNVRSPADNARNKELASNFSECMFTQGWTIATPPPVAVTVPNQPPVGSPVRPGSTAVGYGSPGPYANNSTYPGQVIGGPVQASAARPATVTGAAAAPPPGQGLPGSPAGASSSMPAAAYTVPPAVIVGAGAANESKPQPAPMVPASPASRPTPKKAGGSPQAVFDSEFD